MSFAKRPTLTKCFTGLIEPARSSVGFLDVALKTRENPGSVEVQARLARCTVDEGRSDTNIEIWVCFWPNSGVYLRVKNL